MRRSSCLAAMTVASLMLAGCTVIPEGDRGGSRPAAIPARPQPLPGNSQGHGAGRTTVPVNPARTLPRPVTTTPIAGGAAVAAGVQRGPAVDRLLSDSEAGPVSALRAFRASCPALLRRTDLSGLTAGSNWQPACAAAANTGDSQARQFFSRYFEVVQVGDGKAYATGYYEPEIAGCRRPTSRCDVPLYRRPDDLIEVDLSQFSTGLRGKTIRGKVDGTKFVPYDDRARITSGSLTGRGLELAYADDPIELFFLEVQGSGRLRLPDGGVMRVGYASQNGRDYTGIGKLMKDRGLIQAGSMQDIMTYLRGHPAEADGIMNENKSYVFFREITGDGPIGALGIPVTPRTTVAADPAFVPLGAPVILSVDRQEASGIWVAQDTGGAIKGANRFDTFWGAGSEARTVAGGMSGRGAAWLLLPVGTMARFGR